MKRWWTKFRYNHPYVHFVIAGVGGAALIVAAIDGSFYAVGGERLVDHLGIVTILAGAVWLVTHYFQLINVELLRRRNG